MQQREERRKWCDESLLFWKDKKWRDRESPPLLFATLFAVKRTNLRQFGPIHEHVIRHIIYRTRRRGRCSNPRRLQSRITHHKGAEYYQGFCQRLGNTLCARDIYMLNVKETNSNPAFIWLDKRYSCCWMLHARRADEYLRLSLAACLICSSSNAQKLSRRAFVKLLWHMQIPAKGTPPWEFAMKQ